MSIAPRYYASTKFLIGRLSSRSILWGGGEPGFTTYLPKGTRARVDYVWSSDLVRAGNLEPPPLEERATGAVPRCPVRPHRWWRGSHRLVNGPSL